MKKTIFVSVILVAFVANISAQRYSMNKYKYDYRMYIPEIGDPYNPGVSAICSLFLPGLGQMISGETGRGFAFLGGFFGCMLVTEVGFIQLSSNSGYYGYSGNSTKGLGTLLLGMGGMTAVSIWSIVDAIHVAKVNNMYIQNLRKTSSLKLEMSPYTEKLSINNQVVTPVGLSMRVKF